MRSREAVIPFLVLPVAAALLLAGCGITAPSTAPDSPTAAPSGHGYIEGAVETTEPQLHLAAVSSSGSITLLDLLDGTTSTIAGSFAPDAVTTDGRLLFAAADGRLEIIDTGVWTVPHGDHSHYYRAESRPIGSVTGIGVPTVAPGESLTVVSFEDTTIVMDTEALGDGSIVEIDRHTTPADLRVPVGSHILTAANGSVAVDDGDPVACTTPAGTIATRVGTVIGCAEGAVLATIVDDDVDIELIPYPAGAAEAATSFDGRKGRPTVAGVASDAGAWLLDTRERSWTLLPTEIPLLQVAAVDDTREHVVALAADGRILSLDATTGATIAATEPLLPDSLGRPDILSGVRLTVDASRAYVNAPLEGLVHEIDFADDARIARSFEVDAAHLAETGR